MQFKREQCRDLEFIRSREWLVTNGIGGYASSTVAGMNTRRYHGLLVAATEPPLGRLVLLSQLEDAVTIGGTRYPLSTNRYQGDVIYPSGYQHLTEFQMDTSPVFTYGDGDWRIIKTICMVPGQNTSVIEYRLEGAREEAEVYLEVRPLVAFRDYHGSTHENEALSRTVERQPGMVAIHPYRMLPKLYISHDEAVVQEEGFWYRGFTYEQERERGLDDSEDLFSPLLFRASLHATKSFAIIASTEPQPIERLDQFKRMTTRRDALSFYNFRAKYGSSDLIPILYRAANQFIVTRAPFKTIIAGYHWFGDWGRDAMISLPGLLLATDQPGLAREILLEFVRHLDGGMLPNRFPDEGDQPEYNTVDATLWFFEAIRQYVNYQKDDDWRRAALDLVRDCFYGPLKEIVRCHVEGTRYGIHTDDQGFLWAGDSTTQLTWMDAKVGDIAITPRHGRPVEIQGLWFNALRTLAEFATALGEDASAAEYTEMADRLQTNFLETFWNPERKCLFDVAGDQGSDGSVRPNQIFAVSLRYALISGEVARQVVAAVQDELLTPFGLRTLSADDDHYQGTYSGGAWSRDSAYHQGTVWPWLVGPFFTAKLAVSESPEAVLVEIDDWLAEFAQHLEDAGLGQISEIFDGDHPHSPRGCIAQAWSVAEILNLAKVVSRHPLRRR